MTVQSTPDSTFRFSLRDMLAALALVSSSLAMATALGLPTAAGCFVLTVGLWCEATGLRERRRIRMLIGHGCIICSSSLLGALALGWLILDIGPVYSHEEWRGSLEAMLDTAGTDASDVRVWGRGSFLDEEYLWRVRVPPERLSVVAAECGMSDVVPRAVPRKFYRLFPRLWRPAVSKEHRCLATPNFQTERGRDGDHYCAVYDPDRQWLYVWYKSNFLTLPQAAP